MGWLEQIVINKYYMVLDSILGWKTQMLALQDLVKVEMQLVYLTATMWPDKQGEFIQLMRLLAKEKCYWF